MMLSSVSCSGWWPTLPRLCRDSRDNDQRFLRLVATLQQREGLRPIERMAAARIVEWAARPRRRPVPRLSLHMGSLVDLLQEADYWSAREQKEQIGVAQLEHAIEHQQRRVGQLQERMQQEILDGILMIDTDGIQLGRVNGLSVIQVGDYSFGMPNRISATARIGQWRGDRHRTRGRYGRADSQQGGVHSLRLPQPPLRSLSAAIGLGDPGVRAELR